jgi:hypothetical protein
MKISRKFKNYCKFIIKILYFLFPVMHCLQETEKIGLSRNVQHPPNDTNIQVCEAALRVLKGPRTLVELEKTWFYGAVDWRQL